MKRSRLYENLIIFLLYLTVFQDIALGIAYNFWGNQAVIKTLFFTKDVLMLLLFFWALFKRKFPVKILAFYAIYFLIIFIQTIVSIKNQIPIFNILSSVRGWLLMPCLITIGYAIYNKKYFYKHLKRFIGPFMIIVSIFGLLDFFIDSYITSTLPFWKDFVGLGRFMEDIKGQETLFGLPGNFYGQYGGEFFSQKRLVSFWGGPLTAGYILVIPVLYYFFKALNPYGKHWSFKYLICFSIVLLALICTFTRAIILPTLFVLILFVLLKGREDDKLFVIFLIPIVLAVLVLKFDSIYAYIYDGSLIEHINQFTNSFSQVSLFGDGIATFGVHTSIGTESVYISSLGQNGIISLILFIIGNAFPLYLLLKPVKKYKRNLLFYVMIAVGALMLISGFISEQLIAYTSIAPYYIILGYLCNYSRKNHKVKAKRKIEEGSLVYER